MLIVPLLASLALAAPPCRPDRHPADPKVVLRAVIDAWQSGDAKRLKPVVLDGCDRAEGHDADRQDDLYGTALAAVDDAQDLLEVLELSALDVYVTAPPTLGEPIDDPRSRTIRAPLPGLPLHLVVSYQRIASGIVLAAPPVVVIDAVEVASLELDLVEGLVRARAGDDADGSATRRFAREHALMAHGLSYLRERTANARIEPELHWADRVLALSGTPAPLPDDAAVRFMVRRLADAAPLFAAAVRDTVDPRLPPVSTGDTTCEQRAGRTVDEAEALVRRFFAAPRSELLTRLLPRRSCEIAELLEGGDVDREGIDYHLESTRDDLVAVGANLDALAIDVTTLPPATPEGPRRRTWQLPDGLGTVALTFEQAGSSWWLWSIDWRPSTPAGDPQSAQFLALVADLAKAPTGDLGARMAAFSTVGRGATFRGFRAASPSRQKILAEIVPALARLRRQHGAAADAPWVWATIGAALPNLPLRFPEERGWRAVLPPLRDPYAAASPELALAILKPAVAGCGEERLLLRRRWDVGNVAWSRVAMTAWARARVAEARGDSELASRLCRPILDEAPPAPDRRQLEGLALPRSDAPNGDANLAWVSKKLVRVQRGPLTIGPQDPKVPRVVVLMTRMGLWRAEGQEWDMARVAARMARAGRLDVALQVYGDDAAFGERLLCVEHLGRWPAFVDALAAAGDGKDLLALLQGPDIEECLATGAMFVEQRSIEQRLDAYFDPGRNMVLVEDRAWQPTSAADFESNVLAVAKAVKDIAR